MSLWNWEEIEKNINFKFIQSITSDTLPDLIDAIEVERDKKYQLLLKIKHPNRFPVTIKPRENGEIYIDETYAKINTAIHCIEINRLHLVKSISNIISQKDDATSSIFHIGHIKVCLTPVSQNNNIERVIEYIGNIPPGYIWPNGFNEEIHNKKTRKYSNNSELEFTDEQISRNGSRESIVLQLNGITTILGKFKSEKLDSISPGYIIYIGNPDSKTRGDIRESISFIFGRPLVHFSTEFYSASGSLIESEFYSAETMDGKIWTIAPQPPTPITQTTHEKGGITNILDQNLIQYSINQVLNNIDLYNLSSIYKKLNYAEIAPQFMKPAYYGALIEGLQKSYIDKKSNRISSTLIDKKDYKKGIKTLKKYLEKQNISEETKKLFLHKIENGNMAPQRIISERFYHQLGLTLKDIEKNAWDRRNDAAHGNEVSSENTIDFMRQTKILKIMLNRIILKITGASKQYVDYYTHGYRVRLIQESIED